MGFDMWKLTLRMKNITASDIIVYGQKFDDDFDALNYVQYRNPHLCEWEYGYGDSIRRVPWDKMSDHERVPHVLKAGEYIDSERGFNAFHVNTVTRYSAFVSTSTAIKPTEVFSEPINLVFDKKSNKLSYMLVDNTCSPQCKIGLAESPSIRGIRLGMPISEFRSLYPKIEISTLYKEPDSFKVAHLWDWKQDAYSVDITFINDKVGSIEPKYRSLNKARNRDDFWELISTTIGMPYFWEPFRQEWKCPDFVIKVVSNEDPNIYIQTNEFIIVRDRLIEEDWKKK